ncbi:MAG: hypothetical protein CM15mP70_02110 [Pelagibacteraceae bacterium]|nr:MAG: hypothetical protein CM15mP70_02110 [Pelagibacteraceae bacterium]
MFLNTILNYLIPKKKKFWGSSGAGGKKKIWPIKKNIEIIKKF